MRWLQIGSTLFGFNDDLTRVTIKTVDGEVFTTDLAAFFAGYNAAKSPATSDINLNERLNLWATHHKNKHADVQEVIAKRERRGATGYDAPERTSPSAAR